MTFKKTEKEIIKAIVKYGDGKCSLAEALDKGKLLEKKGIAIIHANGRNYVFLDKAFHDDWFANDGLGYVAELIALKELLVQMRLIVLIPYVSAYSHTIGVNGFRGVKPDVYVTDENEVICLAERNVNWFDNNRNQKCWPCDYSEKEMPLAHFFNCAYSVSQELRDLVKHHFKTEEEIRFIKQQRLTWISIAVTGFIGLASLIIAIIGIYIR
jgi:hypothetical protein